MRLSSAAQQTRSSFFLSASKMSVSPQPPQALQWSEFLLPTGSLSAAVTSRPEGRLCGLLRVGKHAATTLVITSDAMEAPLTLQKFTCDSRGCQSSETIPAVKGNTHRFRLSLDNSQIELDVDRPSQDRLVVSINGKVGSRTERHLVRYYADRGIVALGDTESVQPSLMRGGMKTRIGRAFGLGIYAVQDIEAGEVVEEAPVLSQSSPFLVDYTFAHEGKHILPLGNIALYNHSDTPSCIHSLDARGEIMTLTAARKIRAGEQCSIAYGPAYWLARGHTPQPLA